MWYVVLVAVVNLAIGFVWGVRQARRQRAAEWAPKAAAVVAPGVRPFPAAKSGLALAALPDSGGTGPTDIVVKPVVGTRGAIPRATEASTPLVGDPRQTLDELDSLVAQHQRQLTAIDDRVQRMTQPIQPEQLAPCVRELAEAHRQFLSGQDAMDLVVLPIGAPQGLEEAHKRLVALWQQQCLEVSEAQRWTSRFRPTDNLGDQSQQMTQWSDKMLQIGRELRATLAEVMNGFSDPLATVPGPETAEQFVQS